MAGIDVNRTTAGIVLNPEQLEEVWGNAIEESAVMRLANRVNLPGNGGSVDIITGDAEASWVAETDVKPVSRPTFGSKLMTPYTAAVLVPFSNQFKRDKAALYNEVVRRLPAALARKFDSTVLGGTAPGSNFDTLTAASAVGIAGDTYAGLIAADQAIATGGGVLNGWALSPQARGLLLGSMDQQGRPLFINNVQTDGSVPALLGAPVYQTKAVYKAGTPNQLGFAGDWTSAHYGIVEDVQISFSNEASIPDGDGLIHLFAQNMFAVRCEFEVGFRVRDIAHFAKLTDTVQA